MTMRIKLYQRSRKNSRFLIWFGKKGRQKRPMIIQESNMSVSFERKYEARSVISRIWLSVAIRPLKKRPLAGATYAWILAHHPLRSLLEQTYAWLIWRVKFSRFITKSG